MQKLILALWWGVLLLGLVAFIRVGMRNTGARRATLLHRSTEDVQREIDTEGARHGGRIGVVDVPLPASAPAMA